MSINYLLISTKINFQIILPLRFEFLVKLLKQPFQVKRPYNFLDNKKKRKKGRRYKLEISINGRVLFLLFTCNLYLRV